jgi:signal transduction histidine kinase
MVRNDSSSPDGFVPVECFEAAREQLVRSASLIAMGKLASEVIHELNNSLTGVLALSQLFIRAHLPTETRKNAERLIHQEAERCAELTRNLLSLARPDSAEIDDLDLNQAVEKALRLKTYNLEVTNIQVAVEFAPSMPKIRGNVRQIESVMLNIINNAQQAMLQAHGGGRLQIKTSLTPDNVVVVFADDGPGISPQHLDRVFDAFFTTRASMGGTGLGLSLSRDIIRGHAGCIWTESERGQGATFHIKLPYGTSGAHPQP